MNLTKIIAHLAIIAAAMGSLAEAGNIAQQAQQNISKADTYTESSGVAKVTLAPSTKPIIVALTPCPKTKTPTTTPIVTPAPTTPSPPIVTPAPTTPSPNQGKVLPPPPPQKVAAANWKTTCLGKASGLVPGGSRTQPRQHVTRTKTPKRYSLSSQRNSSCACIV
ncbi:hypothetical protein GQ600_19443 [Phytophthora cactorum]|nr:hypothetical protein GQ600_19443 [Phytophthora cactorum]